MPEKKTTNSIHEEHRARMQERVARDGLTSLAAHEVLEYLLYFSIPRRDTNPLACLLYTSCLISKLPPLRSTWSSMMPRALPRLLPMQAA